VPVNGTASWSDRVDEANAATRIAGRWRSMNDFDARGTRGTLRPDTEVVSFASNDYLGLSTHPAVIAAAHEALDRWGTGSGASRLVTGTRPVHTELETELASWKAADSALLFPNGFAANLGVLSTLAGPGVTVFSDEFNHASIIDGCRLARAEVVVYRHRDTEQLSGLLARHRGPAIVVTEAVFSMDGDEAPVDDLAEACHRWGGLLVVDEAHAVMGQAWPAPAGDVVRVGTLSKTLGSLGGYVAASTQIVELLVNQARPFIFTTAVTPADTAAALAALRIVRSDEGAKLKARLRHHVNRLAPASPSPIVPIVIGDERAALAASAGLLAAGILVPAIRPPTVPPGTSRLRVTLSAAHSDADMDRLLAALGAVHVPA